MGSVSRPVERCDTCEFYVGVYAEPYAETEGLRANQGVCRRFPPVLWGHKLEVANDSAVGLQPVVDGDQSCGEWQTIESAT